MHLLIYKLCFHLTIIKIYFSIFISIQYNYDCLVSATAVSISWKQIMVVILKNKMFVSSALTHREFSNIDVSKYIGSLGFSSSGSNRPPFFNFLNCLKNSEEINYKIGVENIVGCFFVFFTWKETNFPSTLENDLQSVSSFQGSHFSSSLIYHTINRLCRKQQSLCTWAQSILTGYFLPMISNIA